MLSGLEEMGVMQRKSPVLVTKLGQEEDPVKEFARVNHVFAEGPNMLLSDLLLYPVYHLVNQRTDLLSDSSPFPGISEWLTRVGQEGLGEALQPLLCGDEDRVALAHLPVPSVPQHSLYKCDPARDGNNRAYTTQYKVEAGLAWWQDSGLDSLQQGERGEELDWASLPAVVRPEAGQLPPGRLARKEGQLASLALPLVALARDGDILVDFCSGGGHLGLVVAHLVPGCTVHMVENKEESLARARARGMAMGRDNTWFFQSNLDYYTGRFQVEYTSYCFCISSSTPGRLLPARLRPGH